MTFLHNLLEEQWEEGRKEDLELIFQTLAEQEEWWKRELWKRITEGDSLWESQFREIHHKIQLLSQQLELLSQKLELIKERLRKLENRPAKDNQKFQEWKKALSSAMVEVARSIDQLFQVLSEWEG